LRTRAGKSLSVSIADTHRLKSVARDSSTPQKQVWRSEIVLLTADGVDTNAIMRRTGKSKTCVWRWQERFIEKGFDGLFHDKTRPSLVKRETAEWQRIGVGSRSSRQADHACSSLANSPTPVAGFGAGASLAGGWRSGYRRSCISGRSWRGPPARLLGATLSEELRPRLPVRRSRGLGSFPLFAAWLHDALCIGHD
jgi:hypothetical protein